MLKRPKILVAGSFNMDLTASCTRAPGSGETVIGKKFRTAPGGKGFNQAVHDLIDTPFLTVPRRGGVKQHLPVVHVEHIA